MEKGQGFEYRWKDWPLTGGRKRALEQTQSYLRFDGRKLRVLIWWLFSLWSRRQGHPLRMNGQWGSWTFDKSIAGLCYCWGGRWGWWSWIFLGTNLDNILKSRDITLLTKVHITKAMAFPVDMYGCESWIIKNVECWRSDAFKLCAGEDSWESLGQQGDKTSQS